jgi:hypothetical protein
VVAIPAREGFKPPLVHPQESLLGDRLGEKERVAIDLPELVIDPSPQDGLGSENGRGHKLPLTDKPPPEQPAFGLVRFKGKRGPAASGKSEPRTHRQKTRWKSWTVVDGVAPLTQTREQ